MPAPAIGTPFVARDGRTWLQSRLDGVMWVVCADGVPRTHNRGYDFKCVDGNVLVANVDHHGLEVQADGRRVDAFGLAQAPLQWPLAQQYVEPAQRQRMPPPGWYQTWNGPRWWDGVCWVEPDGTRHAPGVP